MPGHSSGEEEIPQEEQQGALVGTELERVYDTEIMIEVIYVYIYMYIYIFDLSNFEAYFRWNLRVRAG